MKVYVEGYGCSANLAETEQIKGFVLQHGAELVSDVALADFIVVNSCAVKKKTEFSMQRRIRFLNAAKKKGARLIVSGCLPKVNPELVSATAPGVIQTGAELEGVSQALGFERTGFSPHIPHVRSNEWVSVVPIAKGCLSNCSFCGTKRARGQLASFPVTDIRDHFAAVVKQTPEVWLASQDNGCYGFDLGTNLPRLVSELLCVEGDFRIRIGMMSPQYIERYYDAFVDLFSDDRVYRFLHLPVQSASNRVLRVMRRSYSIEQFEELVKRLRNDLGAFSLATDLIVGFPTETESEFLESVALVERVGFDVVNISRYGLRPKTLAAQMPQVDEREKARRSHFLHRVCRNVFLKRNQALVGTTHTALAGERAKFGGVICRTNAFKPVVVPTEWPAGSFVRLRITEASATFLKGTVIETLVPSKAVVSLPIV